jgi:hypothetical protein
MMETKDPRGVLIALSDCVDEGKEKEFNKWYNEIHIPEIEALGFVKNTKRYENVLSKTGTFQGRPKYLAVWEVYRDDLKLALEDIRRRDAELKEQGKGFDGIVKMVDALYEKVGPEITTERTGSPAQGVYLVLCCPTDPAREDEFNTWYDERHAPDALALGYQDTCYRYKIVDKSDVIPFRYYYASIYDISMDPLEAREKLISFRYKWLEDPLWVDLLGVSWTGGFRQIYPALGSR